MPSSQQAIQVTDSYRARLTILRQRAELLTATAWRDVNPDDLDATVPAWARLTALRLTELQRAGVTLTGAYLGAFVAIESGRRSPALGPGSDLSRIGLSRAGKPLAVALATTAITVKQAIGDGKPVREAMGIGLNQAVRNANEDVAFTARQALDDGIKGRDEIVGWRRVTGGGCGACLAAATGAIQHDDVVMPVHDHCQCTKEPVVRHVSDRVLRPTGEQIFHQMTAREQDALFAGRGGADKADLIRSGQVPFHALIEHQHMDAIPDVITERPLDALQQHVN